MESIWRIIDSDLKEYSKILARLESSSQVHWHSVTGWNWRNEFNNDLDSQLLAELQQTYVSFDYKIKYNLNIHQFVNLKKKECVCRLSSWQVATLENIVKVSLNYQQAMDS